MLGVKTNLVSIVFIGGNGIRVEEIFSLLDFMHQIDFFNFKKVLVPAKNEGFGFARLKFDSDLNWLINLRVHTESIPKIIRLVNQV